MQVDRMLRDRKDQEKEMEWMQVGSTLCIHMCVYACVHTVAFPKSPSNPLPLFSLSALSLLAHGPANAEGVAAKPVDFAIVSNFVPRMAHKWDMIGIQLHQDDLVNQLWHSNNASGNCMQILQAAMGSGCLSNYETLVKILSSTGVGLSQVAADMLKEVVDAEQDRELMQQPADSDLQPPPPPTSLDSSERARLMGNATT